MTVIAYFPPAKSGESGSEGKWLMSGYQPPRSVKIAALRNFVAFRVILAHMAIKRMRRAEKDRRRFGSVRGYYETSAKRTRCVSQEASQFTRGCFQGPGNRPVLTPALRPALPQGLCVRFAYI
jgi:hypothetical protein